MKSAMILFNKIQNFLKENIKIDILIIGAGISGFTLAERYSSLGKKVLVLEKRDHIGGNCFDFLNQDGILVSKYGPHYFHTNNKMVWEYVSKFTEWIPYEHRVVSWVDGKKVPMPVNMQTINILFGKKFTKEEQVAKWFEENRGDIKNPSNAEDAVIARMGVDLYELLFKGYTEKQWGMQPKELGPEVTNRIPFRTNNDDRYFTDEYQGVPKFGYTKLFENLGSSNNIYVVLNTDYEDYRKKLFSVDKTFFTGRIDQYFNEKFGKLQYRSLRFEFETLDREFFQEYAQENYPSLDVAYTRIVEYKRATGQKSSKTTISKEYSTWDGEPYYPVPSQRNLDIYSKYQAEALDLEKQNIFFVGRLANYKYFNMDQAFENALNLFSRLEE